MTQLVIPPHQYGKVHLFEVLLPKDDLIQTPPSGANPAMIGAGPVAIQLTGDEGLNPRSAALFEMADLGDQPFSQFLIQVEDLSQDQVLRDAARLDALRGQVLLVGSAAFEGRGVTLDLGDRLALIGTYDVVRNPVRFDPLPSEAAKGVLTPPPDLAKTNRRMMGLVSTITLLLMLGLVALMIWIAG